MTTPNRTSSGFTLVEVIVVVIILGVLAGVAIQNVGRIADDTRVEQTRVELERLAIGAAGDAARELPGEVVSYGYVGDVGALPGSVNDLITNPGGYATWNGPYVTAEINERGNDPITDPWGATYILSGTTVRSTGNGSPIVRHIASSSDALLINRVTGQLSDLDGSPPGEIMIDSLTATITIPNGSGGTTTRSSSINRGGSFVFDSIPVGRHLMRVIDNSIDDTLQRTVTIGPASEIVTDWRFSRNWIVDTGSTGGSGGASGMEMVVSSDTVWSSSPHNENFTVWMQNGASDTLTITSITVEWDAPTAYYGQITWNGTTVFNEDGSPRGVSATSYPISPPASPPGELIQLQVRDFRANNTSGGGSKQDVSGASVTITLSDGSGLSFVL